MPPPRPMHEETLLAMTSYQLGACWSEYRAMRCRMSDCSRLSRGGGARRRPIVQMPLVAWGLSLRITFNEGPCGRLQRQGRWSFQQREHRNFKHTLITTAIFLNTASEQETTTFVQNLWASNSLIRCLKNVHVFFITF